MSFLKFYHKIMKQLYMHTIIGSSGRDCVLIKSYFNFIKVLRLGFLRVIYPEWVNITPFLNLHIGRRTNSILM